MVVGHLFSFDSPSIHILNKCIHSADHRIINLFSKFCVQYFSGNGFSKSIIVQHLSIYVSVKSAGRSVWRMPPFLEAGGMLDVPSQASGGGN